MRALFHRYTRAALVVSITVASLWMLPRLGQLDTAHLTDWLRVFGPYAPLIFIVARTTGSVLFVPGSLMALTAGALFGIFPGAAYNLIASTAGALAAFGVARYVAPNWIGGHVVRRPSLGRLVDGIEANGWKFVAFVRLVPLFPYNVVNYAFGLTPVRFIDFAWATLIFMIPADVAYVYIGYAGREALLGDPDAWVLALGAFAALAVLTAIPLIYRARARNRRSRAD